MFGIAHGMWTVDWLPCRVVGPCNIVWVPGGEDDDHQLKLQQMLILQQHSGIVEMLNVKAIVHRE